MSVLLRAPVMGTVSNQNCDDGAEVAEEDIVLMIESMKMNFEVRAPASGVVHFRCELGQVVNKGDAVAELT